MASSKGISFGRLIVKNLHTIHLSTCSQNTKILKDSTTRSRLVQPSINTSSLARRSFSDLYGNKELLPPPSPPPSSPQSSNRSKWAAGFAVTTIITLLQFKEEVELAMATTEEVIEAVEVVAEAVDMVAEKIGDDLPDGSKLKTTVEMVEEVAETVARKAQKAVEFIDEVQEAEEKLSPIIEPVKQLTQVDPSDAS